MKKYKLVVVSALFSVMANAAVSSDTEERVDGVVVIDTSVFGTGCADEKIARIGGGNTFSIMFDDFNLDSNKRNGFDTINCDVVLELLVAKGYQAAFSDARYVGTVGVPKGGQALLDIRYQFHSESAKTIVKKWENVDVNAAGKTVVIPFDFLTLDTDESLVWSSCGSNRLLMVDINSIVQDGENEQATTFGLNLEVDGSEGKDVRPGMSFKIRTRACEIN